MAKMPEYLHFRTVVKAKGTEVELHDVSDHDFVEVVRGKWIRGNESRTSPTKDSYICSVCGEKTLSGFCGNPAKTNFCPNCGADMREPNLDTTKGKA